jgi:threonine dehydrogenase-like Zn-dependent dehydrogenase
MEFSTPEKMLAWPLFGTGMEKLGTNDEACVVDVPTIGDDELLVKIDAIGLCFSDIKLIRAGEDHPRVISEDLEKDPVIPGHEAVMTVVKVGNKVEDKFKPGQRYIIQADIYVNGKGFAYGYAIDGGMAQYSKIDQRVLNGDEGCYLLPLQDATPSALAALIEPWTCVIASYMIENRSTPKDNGKVLIVMEDEQSAFTVGNLLKEHPPKSITCVNCNEKAIYELEKELPVSTLNEQDALPEKAEFDDIFIINVKDRQLAEKAAKLGTKNAVISFIGDYPEEAWSFDIGNIHYEGWYYQGTKTNNLSEAYGRNLRSTLKENGCCWLPGGAGAMGQMHTQLAITSENGPKKILVSDLDNSRLENVKNLLKDDIEKRGIEFKTLNPTEFASPEEFYSEVKAFCGDEGFDDIVMLVPVIPVLNDAAPFLKTDGLMNIFAGIPAGKEGVLNINGIVENGMRYIGSSGSLTSHLRYTLEMVESGKLEPSTALAAIGGMKDLKKGLEAVANAKFPGKTVIFPNCEDMPLTPFAEISSLDEKISKALKNGSAAYNLDVEKILFDKYGK